jgi:hypothetical protein
VLSIDSVAEDAKHTEVEIRILADFLALEEFRKPGERIRTVAGRWAYDFDGHARRRGHQNRERTGQPRRRIVTGFPTNTPVNP